MEPVYRFGPFQLDPVSRRLTRDGVTIELTSKMLDILLLLVRNGGDVVTREAILSEVWPDTVISENNISVQVSKLRKALGETARDWRFIETVARRGYRFSHAVCTESARDEQVTYQGGDDAASDTAVTPGRSGGSRGRPVRRGPMSNRAAVPPDDVSVDSTGIRTRRYPRIAVLPFRNIAGDDFFATGITESLIANLTQVGALRVISQTSVMCFRERHVPLPEIAEELSADYVVEGSVFQASDRVRITAQLIRAADDQHVWAQQYEREIRDLLGLQNEVTVAISREVGVRLTSGERSRLTGSPVLSDSSVYRLYLRGRYLRNKNTPEDFWRAISYLQQAIQVDPNFASPYCLLAQTHFMLGIFGLVPRDVAARRVRRFVDEAFRRDARLPEAYISLGLQNEFFDWDWTAAEAAFREAVRLAPGSSTARQEFGAFLSRIGRPDQARSEMAHALSLNPLSANAQTLSAETLYYRGHYNASAAECRNALEFDSSYVWARVVLGWALLQLGSKRDAVDVLSDAAEASGRSPFALGSLGHAYAVTGDRSAANDVLNELEQQFEQATDVSVFAALVALGLSRTREALNWLDRAVERKSAWILLVRADPRFQALRGEPRYEALLRRIGLDPEARAYR